MDKDFALTAALGAIELHLLHHEPRCVYLDSVLPAIREALAQPEPVYKITVVDDQHPSGIALEQWGKPTEQEPWCMKMNGCKTKCEDCPDEAAQPEQEPLEYWNAVEGWVKIDEVRQHFETVSCGTIYKTAGEGRVPLYTTPPKREPLTDQRINEIYQEATCQSLRPQDYKLVREFARAIEAAHGIKEKNND